MVSFFVMWGNASERVLNQQAISRESLKQPRRVVISHYRDLIDWFQSGDSFHRGVMHLVAKWIETAASINQQQNRKGQAVLTKVRDLLFGSIFVKQKIFLLQPSDDARSILLQNQSVNGHQIDVYL